MLVLWLSAQARADFTCVCALEPRYNEIEGGAVITSLYSLLPYIHYWHLLQYVLNGVHHCKHRNKRALRPAEPLHGHACDEI